MAFPLCSLPTLCVINRYGRCSMESYRENLERVFVRMDQVLPDSCLLVWNMAMPLGERVTGGFLLPEASNWGPFGQGMKEKLADRQGTLIEAALSPSASATGRHSTAGCG